MGRTPNRGIQAHLFRPRGPTTLGMSNCGYPRTPYGIRPGDGRAPMLAPEFGPPVVAMNGVAGGQRCLSGGGERMKVVVDTDACTGHGRCYTLAPEVFEPDDQGHSQLVSEEVPESLRDKAVIGMQNCPERAISVEG